MRTGDGARSPGTEQAVGVGAGVYYLAKSLICACERLGRSERRRHGVLPVMVIFLTALCFYGRHS